MAHTASPDQPLVTLLMTGRANVDGWSAGTPQLANIFLFYCVTVL